MTAPRSWARTLVVLGALAVARTAQPSEPDPSPVVAGLDHVVVAVRDLDAAAQRFRALGFSLKPGRAHPNGIRNAHAKFPDGTEIELLGVVAARDALAREYAAHLASGDGPAFVALYAPRPDALARRLDDLGRRYRRDGALIEFPAGDRLRHVFFWRRNLASSDRPEHLAHPNGAQSLVAVWIACENPALERGLLAGLGARVAETIVRVPDEAAAITATLGAGEVVLLPRERRLAPGRPLVGASVRTRSLAAARDAIARAGLPVPTAVRTARGTSIFLAPAVAGGLWLEIREE